MTRQQHPEKKTLGNCHCIAAKHSPAVRGELAASEEEEPEEGPLDVVEQSPDGREETAGAECTASVYERPGTTALTLGRGEENRRLATSTTNEW
jgi:hypothetical protein